MKNSATTSYNYIIPYTTNWVRSAVILPTDNLQRSASFYLRKQKPYTVKYTLYTYAVETKYQNRSNHYSRRQTEIIIF
jgi:hypothetical protein